MRGLKYSRSTAAAVPFAQSALQSTWRKEGARHARSYPGGGCQIEKWSGGYERVGVIHSYRLRSRRGLQHFPGRRGQAIGILAQALERGKGVVVFRNSGCPEGWTRSDATCGGERVNPPGPRRQTIQDPVAPPPLHNPDAERNVLGSILVDGLPALEAAIQLELRPEHFLIDAHRLTFSTMLELTRNGDAIDTTDAARSDEACRLR